MWVGIGGGGGHHKLFLARSSGCGGGSDGAGTTPYLSVRCVVPNATLGSRGGFPRVVPESRGSGVGRSLHCCARMTVDRRASLCPLVLAWRMSSLVERVVG